MHVVDRSIRETIPNPWYSIHYSKVFVQTGGDLFLEEDYTQQGARLILLKSITIQCVNNGGGDLILVDNINRQIMNIYEDRQITGFYPFDWIINSARLKLTLIGSTGLKIKVVAHYQFIQDLPEQKEAK